MTILASRTTDDRPWYPVHAMDVLNIDVELALRGYALIGYLARHPRSGVLMWWTRRADGEPSIIAPHRARGGRFEVLAWRPVGDWSRPLPEPLRQPRRRPVQLRTMAPVDGPEPDGWPHPGIRLGMRTKPVSQQETEARVLRGIRTMRAPGVVRLDHPGWRSYWPTILTEWADRIAQAEHVDSELAAVEVLWVPTRRDLTDWDFALAWWTTLPGKTRWIIAARAANPRYGWEWIANVAKCSVPTVQRRYQRAIERMHRVATA